MNRIQDKNSRIMEKALPLKGKGYRRRGLIFSSNPKAFTLVEVIVAMAIITILCTLAVPGMGSLMRTYRLKSAANDLASLLQLARMTAMARSADCVVSFDVGAQTVTLFVDNGSGGGTQGNKTQESGEPTIKTLDIRNEYAQQITLGTPSFGSSVTFDSRGLPDTSGTVPLQTGAGTNKQIVVSASGAVKIN
jgi:prepilin-type N-terminal cleavage/methylation domain-containing protein